MEGAFRGLSARLENFMLQYQESYQIEGKREGQAGPEPLMFYLVLIVQFNPTHPSMMCF